MVLKSPARETISPSEWPRIRSFTIAFPQEPTAPMAQTLLFTVEKTINSGAGDTQISPRTRVRPPSYPPDERSRSTVEFPFRAVLETPSVPRGKRDYTRAAVGTSGGRSGGDGRKEGRQAPTVSLFSRGILQSFKSDAEQRGISTLRSRRRAEWESELGPRSNPGFPRGVKRVGEKIQLDTVSRLMREC